jgi:hypothetical protein
MSPLVTQQTFGRMPAEVGALKVKQTPIRQSHTALAPAKLERVLAGNQ